MSHRVEWAPPARRDLARLPATIAGAILAYVDGLRRRPTSTADSRATRAGWARSPLDGDLAGLVTAGNGDYRILLRVADDPAVSWIIHVDHRAHLYRPR